MVDRDYYACCVLRFDASGQATDANYNYVGGIVVPVGTRLHVTGAGGRIVTFTTADDPSRSLALRFAFGTDQWNAADYFQAILSSDDPRTTMSDVPSDMSDAVAHGRLLVGMTKTQALMARGYPPMHHTDGVAADDWIYYETRALVTHVTFRDGRIQAMEPGAAP
jgi:hypothetical protein